MAIVFHSSAKTDPRRDPILTCYVMEMLELGKDIFWKNSSSGLL